MRCSPTPCTPSSGCRSSAWPDYDGSTRTVALTLGAMVERMGALRYVLGYRFNDEELLATLTTAYLDAARIDGDHRLTPRDADLAVAMPGRADGDRRWRAVATPLTASTPRPPPTPNVAPC